MGVNWLISLFVSATIFALWILCRRLQGTWIGPGGVLCMVWLFGSLLPLFFASSFPIYASAYLLVLAFVAVGVAFTSLPILILSRTEQGRQASLSGSAAEPPIFGSAPELRLLNRVYWISCAIGCLAPVALFQLAVAQFGARDLLDLAAKVTVARYVGEFRQPVFVSIFTMFLFLGAMIGGLLTGLSKSKIRASSRYLLWIAPLLLATLIQTTKASFLYGAVMFGGGLVTGIVARGGDRTVRIERLLFAAVGICVMGFGFIFLGLGARYAASGGDIADNLPKASLYCVGHMGVLGDWMEKGGLNRVEYGGGSFTFGGIFEMLGLQTRAAGLYEEMVTFHGGETSNIYTAFRACIDDFTLPGALVFFAGFSFLGGLGWIGMRRGRRGAAVGVAGFMAWIMWSPITSLFLYNSIIGAFVLFALTVAGTGFVTSGSAVKARLAHHAV